MYLQKELKMGITILNVIIVGTLPYAQSKKGKRDVNRLYIEEYKRNTCSKHELIADFSRSQENDLPFFGLFFSKTWNRSSCPQTVNFSRIENFPCSLTTHGGELRSEN